MIHNMRILLHFLAFIPCVLLSQPASVNLMVDNGRYSESDWYRQLEITNNDGIIIDNDFPNGLR